MNFIGLTLLFLLFFPMVIQFHPDIAFPLTICISLFFYMLFKDYKIFDICLIFILALICLIFNIKQAIVIFSIISSFFMIKIFSERTYKDMHLIYKKTRKE